jgi:hypothetical protein
MPLFDFEHEKLIIKACNTLNTLEEPNISAIAKDFKVDYYQLRCRFNGIPNVLSKKGTKLRLNSY